MTPTILAQGTWLRSKVAVRDSGDWNEREAPAGAVGLIDGVETAAGVVRYTVVFWPSFVVNSWDASEVAAEAEVLPAGHPDIPSPDAFDLASNVADIVADGDVDTDEGTVTFPAGLARRIRAAAGAFAGGADAILECLEGVATDGEEAVVSFADYDRLAGLVGVGDRLSDSYEGAPGERP